MIKQKICAAMLAMSLLLTYSSETVCAAIAASDEPAVRTVEAPSQTEGTFTSDGYHQVPFDMPIADPEPGLRSYRTSLPARYDNRSRLPAPRDQRPYQTCWAFAAMAAAESGMIFQGKKIAGSTVNQTIDLSEYQLARFQYYHVDDPLHNTTGDRTVGMRYGREVQGKEYLDIGGNNLFATWSMAGWRAGALEASAPYSQLDATGGVLDERLAYQDQAHMQHAYWVSIHQPNLVKQLIMEYGTVATGYLDSYLGLNSATNAYYSGNMSNQGATKYSFGGHAVAIVGWDDNYSRNNFNETCRPKNNGAWLIRNSWGNSQEQGYFWMSYEEITMDDVAMVLLFEDADNYDYNYQYDGSSGIAVLKDYQSKGIVGQNLRGNSVANVFEVKGAQYQFLEAVSIGLASANTSYSLQIYLDPKEGNPASGTPLLASPQKGTETYVGYHTIPLNQPVMLEAGHKFSVVFTFENDADVFVEASYVNGGNLSTAWVRFEAQTQLGQSYYLTSDQRIYDLHSWLSCCARIKAFTNTLTGKVTKAKPGKNGSDTYYKGSQAVASVPIPAPSKLTLSYTEAPVTGSVAKPTVKGVYDSSGKKIDPANYTVSYSNKNSKLPGTYSVTVKFKGSRYSGSLTQKYKLLVYSAKKLKASATTSSIRISWAKNSKASGYYLYAATSKNGTYKKIATIKSNKTTSYTYKNLKPAKNYYFKVKSYQKIGSKTYTSACSDLLYGATKPERVQSLKSTAQSASTIRLSWKRVSGASGYQIYRYDASAKKWKKIAVLGSNIVQFTDKKLKSGTTQKYKVRAYRKNGSSVSYGSYSGVVTIGTKPSQVLSFKAVVQGKSAVKLSWQRVSGASGYQIYVYDRSRKKYVKVATVSKGSTVSKKLSSLKKGTTYQYKVRAYRKIGKAVLYGKFSAVRKVKTLK